MNYRRLAKPVFLLCLLSIFSWRVFAVEYVPISGNVVFGSTPLCSLVLANGQHMFSCDSNASYNLTVPLDGDGLITLQVFAAGFAPFRQDLTSGQAANFTVNMVRDTSGRNFSVRPDLGLSALINRVKTTGGVDFNGTPLCAMILINGQSMFSCGASLGQFDLDVPLDGSGDITIQIFVAGFQPYRKTIPGGFPKIYFSTLQSTTDFLDTGGDTGSIPIDTSTITILQYTPATGETGKIASFNNAASGSSFDLLAVTSSDGKLFGKLIGSSTTYMEYDVDTGNYLGDRSNPYLPYTVETTDNGAYNSHVLKKNGVSLLPTTVPSLDTRDGYKLFFAFDDSVVYMAETTDVEYPLSSSGLNLYRWEYDADVAPVRLLSLPNEAPTAVDLHKGYVVIGLDQDPDNFFINTSTEVILYNGHTDTYKRVDLMGISGRNPQILVPDN